MSKIISPLQIGVSGRVARIDVLEGGIIVKSLDGFDNLILNQGLDSIASRAFAECFTACAVGTGNTAPANADTQLVAEIARTTTYLTGAGNCGTTRNSTTQWTYRRTFDFPIGALNGNYTELGFSWASSGPGNLFSRVLIKAAGIPVSLPVTSSQQLRVVYELYVQFSAAIDNWNVNFGGLWGATSGTSALQAQPASVESGFDGSPLKTLTTAGNINSSQASGGWCLEPSTSNQSLSVCSSAQALAVIGSSNVRTEIGSATLVPNAYTNGNYYRDKVATFGTGIGNGSIQSLNFSTSSAWAALFAAARNKTNLETLSFNLRFAWGRL